MSILLDQEQQELLQKIINAINEAVVLVNSEYEIIYFNKQYIEMFHISEDLIQKKDYSAIKEYVKNFFLSTDQSFIDKSNSSIPFENGLKDEIILKDGRCFLRTIIPLETFKLQCFLFSFRDIIKEKRYEDILKKNQKRYQKLLNHITDLVLLHSDFKCFYANLAAAKCLGYKNPKELLGRDLRNFLPKDMAELLENRNEKIIKELDLGNSLEFKIVNKNNNVHWLKLISCTEFQERENLWMSMLKDITKDKIAKRSRRLLKKKKERLEERLKSNQFKYDFFTNRSHELKTPINIISAATYMLGIDMEKYSEKEKKYIDIIDINCKRLVRELNNFIDLERIESGYFIMNMEVCNIVHIIEDITLSVIPYTERKEIELIFDTNVEEKYINVDISSIERIILNLLSNAIKFTKPNGNIQVLFKELEQGIEIIIQDTGIGIAQESLEYIFERFAQESRSHGYNLRGSGLGLYLVKNLVEIMGGSIGAESEVGKGTAFTITLPVTGSIDMARVLETSSMRSYGNSEIIEMELSDIKDTETFENRNKWLKFRVC